MKKRKLIIIFIIILIILGCISNNKKSNNTSTKINSIPDGQVGIVSHKMTLYEIEVIIKNNTHQTLNSVTITANCWDRDGNNLGTASNGQYNVNTTDNYKINIWCPSGTSKYTLSLKYNK